MSRPGTNSPVRVFYCINSKISHVLSLGVFIFLFLQASCSSAQVLGIPLNEAAELLKNGDIGFILKAELPEENPQTRLNHLKMIHNAAPFYAGLIIGKKAEDDPTGADVSAGNRTLREMEILLYCTALDSSTAVEREAALKLITMILETDNEKEALDILGFLNSSKINENKAVSAPLRAACLYRLGRFGEAAEIAAGEDEAENPTMANYSALNTAAASLGEWRKAFLLFSHWRLSLKENTWNTESGINSQENSMLKLELAGFLSGDRSFDVLRWVYNEIDAAEGPLSSVELAVLKGRLSLGNYREALSNFSQALFDGGVIFFRHPQLIVDLGRAFQYTSAMRAEGAKLFRNWAKLLEVTGSSLEAFQAPLLTGGDLDNRELLAYIGTLDGEAINVRKYPVLFYAGRIERAMGEYSASTEFFRSAQLVAPNALQSDACIWYMLMNTMAGNPSLVPHLMINTMPQWNDISYFADILDRMSFYLVGRQDWENVFLIFSGLEALGASSSLAQYAWITGRAIEEGYFKTTRSAENFFRIAFEDGKDSFYYRIMAAAKLGVNFSFDEEKPEEQLQGPGRTPEAKFILGFFECGAASFAFPYLREREDVLPVEELRSIARAFAAAGLRKESLDLVSRYISRSDHEPSREDILLFYPRPFMDMIERYAQEAELEPEILFGLIRTESYFVSDIVSGSNAVGLAQLMAPTAEEMAGRIARRGGPDYRGAEMDLKNPEINIHLGSYYLRYLFEQMGNPMLALLAYNGGMGRVRRWLATDRQRDALPLDLFLETIEYTETREYGRRVLAAAAIYGYLYYGKSMEEAAEAIYR